MPEGHFIVKDMYFNQAVNELSSKGWEIIDETKSNGAKHGNSLIEIQKLANEYRKAAGDDSTVGIFSGKGKVTIPFKSREEIENLLFNFSSDYLAVIDDGFKRRNVVGWIKGKTMMSKYNKTFFIDYMCSKAKILSQSTNPDDLVALTYFKKVNEENKTVIKVYTHFSYVNPVSELGEEVSKLIRTIRQINRRSDLTISAFVVESILQVVRKYNKEFSEYEEFLLFFLALLESKERKEISIYEQLEEIYSDLLVPLF